MSTPPAIQKMLDWQKTNAGRVPYSESASTRLLADDAHMLSATDCSGMFHRMLVHYAGVDPGTYTGNQCQSGTLVTISKADARAGKGLAPGDGILFRWENRALGSDPWDHIAMYAGGGRIWNHGGPGYGPLDWNLQNQVDNAVAVMVRRYIAPATTTPDTSVTTQEVEMLDPKDPVVLALSKQISDLSKQTNALRWQALGDDTNGDGHPEFGGTVQGLVAQEVAKALAPVKAELAAIKAAVTK